MVHVLIQNIAEDNRFMNVVSKPGSEIRAPMLHYPSLLVINMRDSSILSKMYVQSAYHINLCPYC